MFCSKCGKEEKENVKFCTNCGNKLIKDDNDGSILFERKKQFYGVLVPVKIFLDGKLVGSVKAGEKISVPVTVGDHKLAFNLWSGNGQYDIKVSKEKIISIENI